MKSINRIYASAALIAVVATSAIIFGMLTSCSSVPKEAGGSSMASLEMSEIQRNIAGNGRAYPEVQVDPDFEKTVYVEQNWSPGEREAFYRTAQGSHIMPLKFALALEKSDSKERFFGNKNLTNYGFVLQRANSHTNPYGLPVGFTIDGAMRFSFNPLVRHSVEDETKPRMLGVNCALCHTTNLHFKGQAIRIDGGQTLVHFQKFIRDMDFALKANFEDKEKLERFLNRVMDLKLPREPFVTDRSQLVKELEEALRVRADWTNLNDEKTKYGHGYNDTKFPHGPGRIDAFAAIFNEVLARDLGVPENAGEPDAPVSAPVIWDAPHHDRVQWNGLASNDPNNGGPLARNLGQVLGVFGRVFPHEQKTVVAGKGLEGYCSTVRRKGLDDLEEWVSHLWSPLWPEENLGYLDQAKVAQGRKVFEQKCLSCHHDINRKDPNRKVIAQMIPMAKVGTETKFNDNALSRKAVITQLKGRLTRVKEGRPLEENEPAATALKHIVAGSMAGTISVMSCIDTVDVESAKVLERLVGIAGKAFSAKEAKKDDDPNPDKRVAALVDELARYKARPLNGIWASPPFLHNGSVNSLYEILLPPSERKNFYLGCDEYDPIRAGLACTEANGGFLFDTSLVGNKPVGHDYGPKGPNAEEDRMALVEYLKSI